MLIFFFVEFQQVVKLVCAIFSTRLILANNFFVRAPKQQRLKSLYTLSIRCNLDAGSLVHKNNIPNRKTTNNTTTTRF